MAATPLPMPPGFGRLARHSASGKKRWVYPINEDSELGGFAAQIHQGLVEDAHGQWMGSRLRRMALWEGREALRHSLIDLAGKENKERRRALNRKAVTVGMFQLSQLYPLFIRRDPLSQVLEHLQQGGRYYLKLDISDAFGSVWPGVHHCLPLQTKMSPEGDELVWTGWPFFHPEDGGLIQGAPSSPILFDRYCATSGFDAMLREVSKRNRFTVTRYVDDIVFSSHTSLSIELYRKMRMRFADFGFTLNEEKSGRFDTHKKPVQFLGVEVYRGKAKPKPEFLERIKSLMVWNEEGFPVSEGQASWLNRVATINAIVEQQQRTHAPIMREIRAGLARLEFLAAQAKARREA